MKAKLGELVKGYSSTLAQWNRQSQNIQKSLSDIIETSQQLVPQSQAIITMAEHRAEASRRCLGAITAITSASSSSGWRGRGPDRLSVQLAGGPQHHARRSTGCTSAMTQARRRRTRRRRFRRREAKDELGAMARTVIVFRDTMIERERRRRQQAEDQSRARAAQRADRRHHHPVRNVGRPGARQGARSRRQS